MSEALRHLTGELLLWWRPILVIGMLIGFMLVIAALTTLAQGRYSSSGVGRSFKKATVTFLAGILLINILATIDMLSYSLLQTDGPDTLSYIPDSSVTGHYATFAVTAFAVVGAVNLIRGLLKLRHVGDDPNALGSSLTHIFGSILLLNSVTVVQMVARSAGSDFERIVQTMSGM